MIKEEREAYNNWLNERELDEQAKRLNGFERYTIDLEKKSDEQHQRITELETQLAASEAGAGAMRKALESGLESYQIIADFWPHDSVAFGSFAGAFLNWANDAKAALATNAGKAAAEKLARYEAALRAILNSDDNDLGTFAQMCETVAREAMEES